MEQEHVLTPLAIGRWLVDRQLTRFNVLVTAAEGPVEDTPPLELPAEALFEMSVHGYALEVALVSFTYQPLLDDSRFLSGSTGGVDILDFLTRVQSGAREASRPYLSFRDTTVEPLAVAGCALELDELLRNVLVYYSALFAPLASLSLPDSDAVHFAEGAIRAMGTSNELARPVALAYYFAFRQALPNRSATWPDGHTVPNQQVATVVLRTWQAWTRLAFGFQEHLIGFQGTKKIAFE